MIKTLGIFKKPLNRNQVKFRALVTCIGMVIGLLGPIQAATQDSISNQKCMVTKTSGMYKCGLGTAQDRLTSAGHCHASMALSARLTVPRPHLYIP